MAVGTLLFVPAANMANYPLFLLGLFIIGTGLALLQTASNPYVTILGPRESAATRISFMGICNKVAGILSQFEGLLSENVVYKFNADLVEKYGAVLSELILNCPDIEEEDKGNLISGEKTFSVTKGSIDRLMQYDSPEAVFELINPIVALKK
jgi:hypothetical protein